jgi:response regulator RpfG family c-di-GMP phosphodiesterase
MARILLHATDRQRFREVRALLRQDGHDVVAFPALEDWERAEQDTQAQLVVASTASPAEVLAAPPRGRRHVFAPPVLFVHQEADRFDARELDQRLVDRIVSPFQSDELLARVDALVGVFRLLNRQLLADGGAAEPERRSSSEPRPAQPGREVAKRLAQWSDRRDTFEPGHAARVGSLCAWLAETLGIAEAEANVLYHAAALHDIGKVAVPPEILHYEGPLDEEQRRLVRIHPRRGAALVRLLDPQEDVAQAVFCHHERPDGSGYMGCTAEEIPRVAAVLAVAECFDAMTTSCVGPRLEPLEALERLELGKGRLHDADVVGALAARIKPRPDTIPLSTLGYRAPTFEDEEIHPDRMPPE